LVDSAGFCSSGIFGIEGNLHEVSNTRAGPIHNHTRHDVANQRMKKADQA